MKLALALAAVVVSTAPVAKLSVGIQPFGAAEANGALWVTLIGDGRLVKVDPATNKVLARVKVGFAPFAVAYGAGSLWVANSSSNTVSRVNPRTRKVTRTIKVGIRPYDVTFGAGSVWVANNTSHDVTRIDPKRNTVVKRIKAGVEPNGLVVAFGALWVGDRLGNALLKIDVTTNKVVGSLKLSAPDWVTPDADALYVSEETGAVVKVDPASLKVLDRVKVGANPLHTAIVGGDLWVPNIDDSTISIVDRSSLQVRETIPGPSGAIAVIRTRNGGVWVSGSNGSELWRFAS